MDVRVGHCGGMWMLWYVWGLLWGFGVGFGGEWVGVGLGGVWWCEGSSNRIYLLFF
jgi:hypothetical protein